MKTIKFKYFKPSGFLGFLDLLLLIVVIVLLMKNITNIGIDVLLAIFNTDIALSMVNNVSETSIATTQNTSIIISRDNAFASATDAIKSLFIYGAGGLRWHISRSGGTPFTRAAIIGSTIALDNANKILSNTINDPTSLWQLLADATHKENWLRTLMMWKNSDTVVVKLETDVQGETVLSSILEKKEFLPDGSNSFLKEFSDKILFQFMEYFKLVLQPTNNNLSNDVLAVQIHDISIILFFMCLLLSILITGLLINIIVVVNSNRILNFFKNKYIRLYVNINIKLIKLEVVFLGATILYFLFFISKGIHYIATNPIII